MIYRQWYAQLDVFDTMRRCLAISRGWEMGTLSRERLFVSDFYLANPSLLHLTHMTADARRAFSTLKIDRPDQTFIDFPSPPILFTKMGGIQNEAIHNLIGRGIFSVEGLRQDKYALSETGRLLAEQMGRNLVRLSERPILNFLTGEFARLGQGKNGLRAVTGLKRLGLPT